VCEHVYLSERYCVNPDTENIYWSMTENAHNLKVGSAYALTRLHGGRRCTPEWNRLLQSLKVGNGGSLREVKSQLSLTCDLSVGQFSRTHKAGFDESLGGSQHL
jgi:hypothetical protein